MLVKIRLLSSIYVINIGIRFIFILVVSQKNNRRESSYCDSRGKTLRSLRESVLLHSFIYPFIHCVVYLTTRPQPHPNQVRHRLRSSASSQYPVSSLFLKVIQQLLTSSSSSSSHFYPSLYLSFKNVLIQKSVPTQRVTNPVGLPSFY